MISRRDALKLGAAGLVTSSILVGCGDDENANRPTLLAVANQIATASVVDAPIDFSPVFRGNLARTGVTQGPGPSMELPIVARLLYDGFHGSSPIVENGCLYYTMDNAHGSFVAIDTTSGSVVWSFATGPPSLAGDSTSTPTLVDGMVFSGGGDGNLYAVDAQTGTESWRFATEASVSSSPAVANGTVYFSSGFNLHAVNANTGAEEWRYVVADGGYGVTQSSPAIFDGVIYIGNSNSGLVAVDASSGSELWKFGVSYSVGGETCPAVNGDLVFTSARDGLYAIDTATGIERWHFETEDGMYSSPAISNGIAYVGCDDGNLYAIEVSDGTVLWSFSAEDQIRSSPVVTDGIVYFGCARGNVYAIETRTASELWRISTPAESTSEAVDSSPYVVGGTVYVIVNYQGVLAISNLLRPKLVFDTVLRAAPSSNCVERGSAIVGNEIDNLGSVEERSGMTWAEVTIKGVSGWIPLDAIDPATLPPEGEIEYVYVPE